MGGTCSMPDGHVVYKISARLYHDPRIYTTWERRSSDFGYHHRSDFGYGHRNGFHHHGGMRQRVQVDDPKVWVYFLTDSLAIGRSGLCQDYDYATYANIQTITQEGTGMMAKKPVMISYRTRFGMKSKSFFTTEPLDMIMENVNLAFGRQMFVKQAASTPGLFVWRSALAPGTQPPQQKTVVVHAAPRRQQPPPSAAAYSHPKQQPASPPTAPPRVQTTEEGESKLPSYSGI